MRSMILRFGSGLPGLLLASLALGGSFRTAVAQDAKPDAAAPPAAETVTRPEVPQTPPDENELKLRPDEEGRLKFNFQGQPWSAVVEWLAEVSELSLDWQELPAGFLNLHTQQSYSVEEARDLVNRHLLDRGFTLLKNGEVLSVVRITKLDPSLVPRLEPDELVDAMPHDFVRVTFPLDWITAETAVEDLKPLISPNGKLTTIKSSNHLEAMDAVANLRDIRKLVSDPESPRGPRRLVKQFQLEHAKATEVQQQLQKLLGLEKNNPGDPGAIMQQMANFMKQAGVAPGDLTRAKPTQPPPVHIVANARDNSVLVNAPADQMALVTEAIKVIDVPTDRSRSVLRNSSRVQTYPLQVAEPENTVKLLQELADLDPETRLQVDRKNRAIIAHANLADHLTIRTLIDKLDGTVRMFRVIPLHKLEADYVAGSLNLVMGGGEVTKRQSSKDAEDEVRRFRVVADVEKNRLLLWVNDDELSDVRRLLVELGEPADSKEEEVPTTVRVLDAADPVQTESLLRKLQKEWSSLAPNPLELGPGAQVPPAAEPSSAKPEAPRKPRRSAQIEPANAESDVADAAPPAPQPVPLRLTGLTSRPADAPRELDAERDADALASIDSTPVPPVRVERDAQGRLTVASQDPRAVELVQKLFAQSAPNAKGFHVFRMKNKNSWAFSIAENLRLFFDERRKAEEKRTTEQTVARWFDPSGGKWIETPRGDAATALKKVRNPPKFIVDEETNSILAVEADAEQIRTAEQLIQLYDTPETQESPVVRVTKLVPIRFGNPKQVSETVKDVYKDLLAANTDPTPPSGRKKKNQEPSYTLADAKGKPAPGTLLRFKGQLAIGVDESSSSIVISAPSTLADMVAETVTALDDAARMNKPRLQVFKLGKGVDVIEVQKRLNQAINKGR